VTVPEASLATEYLFVALVAVVAGLFVVSLGLALRGASRVRVTALLLSITLVVPMILASAGLLTRYDSIPPPALTPVLIALVTTLIVSFSPIGARIAIRAPLAVLIGYQSFRIAVELLLHRLYAEGVVPVQMTYAGRNFDILSGLSAALIALCLAGGVRIPAVVIRLWNIAGLALLANIVTIAVLSAPVPFRTFHNEPANLLPTMFPFIWLPTFLVPAALFGHLLVFRAVRSRPVSP
jgi:hypothetical protein